EKSHRRPLVKEGAIERVHVVSGGRSALPGSETSLESVEERGQDPADARQALRVRHADAEAGRVHLTLGLGARRNDPPQEARRNTLREDVQSAPRSRFYPEGVAGRSGTSPI